VYISSFDLNGEHKRKENPLSVFCPDVMFDRELYELSCACF